jgi:hypothetical protein
MVTTEVEARSDWRAINVNARQNRTQADKRSTRIPPF